MTVSLLRCAVVWLGVTSAALTTGHWALGALAPAPTAPAFSALVQVAAASALLGCAAWAWSVSTLVIVGAVRLHVSRPAPGLPTPGRLSGPPWLQRVLLTACGATLLATTALVPTHAVAPPAPGPGPVAGEGVRALVGLPLPDRTTGLLRRGRADEALDPVAAVSRAANAISERATYTVRPGDSLWRIAEHLLGPSPTPNEVATLVHHLYATNRAVIGVDPDLIRPGHQLRTPLEGRPAR
ncbi:LysM domain-containing protein [Nocardioides sp.]|uniref:LysM peptidoglycan-binding domain-containing protein n=1 Tax=Nocardioides sp. TaxID=35761 RepID=UPI002B27C220|nr:LysM domain-containing protein [Nocardioides sp.]